MIQQSSDKLILIILMIIKYTFIEVCAGGGGLSSGLIKSGFVPLLLNDNNSDVGYICLRIYKKTIWEIVIILVAENVEFYTVYLWKNVLSKSIFHNYI